MRFSVLIPVYNVEEYLDECILSVLRQTYDNFEILLVDDGSTDHSAAICDRYRSEYPNTVRVIHKENQGLVSARRVGIANAQGEYCVFLDADDYMKNNLLDRLDQLLLSDDRTDILIYSFVYIEANKAERMYRPTEDKVMSWSQNNKRDLYEKLIYTNDITPLWIKACKTSLLQSDPTDYSAYHHKNMAEDLLQSLYPITYAKQIRRVLEPLYCYRYDNISITRSFDSSSMQKLNTVHVYRKILEYLPVWDMDDEESVKRLNARWFDLTMYWFQKYYASAESTKKKKIVLSFDWNALLPCTDVDSYARYIDRNYLNLYRWYSKKLRYKLDGYFFRNKIYRKYREGKQKAINMLLIRSEVKHP